ncbi:binding protein [Escherichia coli]|uniref:Binding protein n=1 Tax=Escherichia coli TaxID=562 RepID=A0A377C0H9_ECOLX|nr:binding protein [Escherichia coli]
MPQLLLRVKQMLHRWGVKATDDRTLEVTLEQPVPWFTTMLAWPTLFPVPHHVIAKHGDSWSKPENMVYNGAFVLDQWVVNEKITARKNPKYRDAQHTVLQQVEYLALDNSVTGYNRYRAGEVDLTWVPAQQIPAIEKITAWRATNYSASEQRILQLQP